MCTVLSDAGFFSGLWHGLTAVFSLIAGIFWDIRVYEQCQNSWFYQLGFLLAFGFVGWMSYAISLYVFFLLLCIVLCIWIASIISGLAWYGFAAGFIVGTPCFIVARKYGWHVTLPTIRLMRR